MPSRTPPRWLVAVAVAAMGSFPLLALPASANETVDANHIVVLSNDISNTTTDVVPNAGSSNASSASQAGAASGSSASSGSGGSGNDNNRSGLGDGTNPGQGASHNNSGNQGTNNPNNAHH